MAELKFNNIILFGIALALITLGSYAILGAAGSRTILGFIIFIFIPMYLIFDSFGIRQEEKIVYSFFIGITLFPSFVYWLGFVVPFRIAILTVFIVLVIVAFLIRKFWKKQHI